MWRHTDNLIAEMEKNWAAFKAHEEPLRAEYLGPTVLPHHGENDSGDSCSIGCERFGLGNVPIQTVGEKPRSQGNLTMHVDA